MSIKPTTMTVLCYLNGNVNITNSHMFLPIIKLYDSNRNSIEYQTEIIKDGEKIKNRITLKNYGLDGALISMRYKNMNRGIRQGGSSFSNSVAGDFQCCKKNVHVKISSTKFTWTGILSEEMAIEASIKLCDLFNLVQDNINYIKKSNLDDILFWINQNYNAILNHCKFQDNLEINIPDNIDLKLFDILSVYIPETKKYEDLYNLIEKMKNLGILCSSELCPLRYELCSIATMSKIDFDQELPLIPLSEYLFYQGVNIHYDNSKGREINILIPSKTESKMCKITLYKGKKLRHNTRNSLEETKEMHDFIQGHVNDFLELYKNGEIQKYLYKKRLEHQK